MTPYEFGCCVKRAVEETGGLGEYLGQGFDNGVKSFNKAVGMPELSPQAWGGGGAMPVPVPAVAPPINYRMGPTAGPATPSPATPAPVRPSPRPAAAKPAPAQPKPTAPGVRKPASRIA